MTFHLHRAVGTDLLSDALAELLATPLADPFAEEVVVVPAKGIERWLSQRLSHRLGSAPGRGDGVCAGVRFRSPTSLVAELVDKGADDPWDPDASVWPLLGVIDEHLGEPWCADLSRHLGHGMDPGDNDAEVRQGRRYSVARRLAGLFASYAVQRPTMLAAWEQGDDRDGLGGALDRDLAWQAELWRLLVARVGQPSPSRRLATALTMLTEDPDRLALPGRLSLFGHTRIPQAEIELLTALGRHRDVHLWLPHPSVELWDALARPGGPIARQDDRSHQQVRNPLLAGLGRDVRELQRSLGPALEAGATISVAGSIAAPGPGNLLSWLQSDLIGDRVPEPGGRTLEPDDRSIQVHACHGMARQVEVLRETLLGLLDADATLEPRDIVVMCPDIEAYAPLVQAAFGSGDQALGSHPGHRLDVRLADRALTQTNPLLGVLGLVLDLAGGRAEASRVRDLMASDPVRRRFGFTESDLETVDTWIDQAGIRWAFDQQHREQYGLDQYVQNTWRFGMDRILAGVAVSEDSGRWFGTTLPLDDVGSTGIEVAGRLAEFLDRVQSVTDEMQGAHPVEHWMAVLTRTVDELTAAPWGEEWQTGQARRELARVREGAGRWPQAGADLQLADVRSLMEARLAGRPTRANFRTGTITVATLVPMRSVPHRVVCLLGLDDGVFPRAGAVDGDDVLARRPVTGERSPRSEDRQLLLDAILAARDTLVVTYTGANETTGRRRPPAVPLGELIDALDATVPGGADLAVRTHPLQAFDPKNFDVARPFSYDVGALLGARSAQLADRAPAPRVGESALPRRGGDVDLVDLIRFLKEPVKAFLRQRLDVVVRDDKEQGGDGIPVEPNGLDRWAIGQRLLADLLAGRLKSDALAKEWRRGALPPGNLGWKIARDLADQAEGLANKADSMRAGRPLRQRDIDVDLGSNRRLRGTVGDLYGDRLVGVNFSTFGPKHLLDAWVPLLALCASAPQVSWQAAFVGRSGSGTAQAAFAAVDGATGFLGELVELYDAGMRAPLPMPLAAGYAWATNRSKPERAISYAERKWAKDKFKNEQNDPAHTLVWGPKPAFGILLAPPLAGEEYPGESTRLGALSSRLWVPILERVI